MQFWLVDVFASSVFDGNPAAVCLLDRNITPAVMQKIAREFNMHETIFVSALQNQHFQIQWFTPFANESICGHGLLAAAHVLWRELNIRSIDKEVIYFDTPLGIFMVSQNGKKLTIHLPSKQAVSAAAPDRLINALGTPPIAVSKCGQIYIVEMFSVKHVFKLDPDIAKLSKIPCNGVVITAEGGDDVEYDFASRFFAPSEGLREDPATLWTHCFLGPYWEHRLNKSTLLAMQYSDREGIISLECCGEQIKITGECVTSASGNLCNMSWSFNNDLFKEG